MSKLRYPCIDVLILLVPALVLQGFFLFAAQSAVECDALTFFNYARHLVGDGGAFHFYRTPGFPLFLIATGQVWEETFYGTVVAHIVFGVTAPLLLYATLRPLNRYVALMAGLTLIATSVLFVYAKAMLPQQLSGYLVLLTVFGYSRFYFTNNSLYIYLSLFSAFLAWFTRGEAMFMPFILGLSMLVIILLRHRKAQTEGRGIPLYRNWRLLNLGVVTASLVACFLIWSDYRATEINNPETFGSLHNWGGRQLFLQPYYIRGNHVQYYRDTLIGGPEAKIPTESLVQPENGPATAALAKYIDEKNIPGTENFFLKPSAFKFDKLTPAMNADFGHIQADKMMRDATIEAIRAYPFLILSFTDTSLDFLGISQRAIAHWWATDAPLSTLLSGRLYRGIGRPGLEYIRVVYNSANCAGGYPAGMFAEHTIDFNAANERYEQLAEPLKQTQIVRSIIRCVIGTCVFVLWWALLVNRNTRFVVPVAILALLTIGAMSLGNTMSIRYETTSQPILIVCSFAALYALLDMIISGLSRLRPSFSRKWPFPIPRP